MVAANPTAPIHNTTRAQPSELNPRSAALTQLNTPKAIVMARSPLIAEVCRTASRYRLPLSILRLRRVSERARKMRATMTVKPSKVAHTGQPQATEPPTRKPMIAALRTHTAPKA